MNRTHIHNVIHADMNHREFKATYITISRCSPGEDFTIHGYLSHILPWKSVVWVFESFYWWPRACFHQPFASAVCCEQTEEQKLHFARKCLSRKWGIKHGKMNQALRLTHFFKMQKLIGYGSTARKCQLLTDSLTLLRHKQAEAWKWPFYSFILCTFLGIMISSWV